MAGTIVALAGALVLGGAYLALVLLLRAVVTGRAWGLWLALTGAASLGWLVFLPRSGVDRLIGFWLGAVVAVGVAWLIRLARKQRTA